MDMGKTVPLEQPHFLPALQAMLRAYGRPSNTVR
jgi:hypothetical protein